MTVSINGDGTITGLVITTADLADSSVTTAKIAAGAVATVDIADGAVTTAKLSSSTGTGAVALASLPTFTTTIGVGGATPSASGAGITFPATQSASTDANTLDDYEEGTFTPVLTDGTRTKNGSGVYTKVGNVVTARMNFGDVENPNSFTGSVYITGLPFTNSANIAAAACFLNYSDSGNIFNAVFSASSTEARVYRVNAQYLDFVNLQGTDLTYYSDLFICGSYFV